MMHARSVRSLTLVEFKNSNGYTVAYIRSLIYVSSRATRCVVSVPAENFIAAHPNKRNKYAMKAVN